MPKSQRFSASGGFPLYLPIVKGSTEGNYLDQEENDLGQARNDLGQEKNDLGQEKNDLGQEKNDLGHFFPRADLRKVTLSCPRAGKK